jgi:hypothetical protein
MMHWKRRGIEKPPNLELWHFNATAIVSKRLRLRHLDRHSRLAIIIMHRSSVILCLLSWCCCGLVGLASAQSTTTDHRHEVGRRQMTTTTTTTTMLRRESAAIDGQHRKLAFWGWAFLGKFSLAGSVFEMKMK